MSKLFHRVSYEVFTRGLEDLQMTGAELSQALGYSKTAHTSWRNDKRIPFTAGLAIEALRKRKHITQTTPATYVVQVPAEKDLTVNSLLKALNCPFHKLNGSAP